MIMTNKHKGNEHYQAEISLYYAEMTETQYKNSMCCNNASSVVADNNKLTNTES